MKQVNMSPETKTNFLYSFWAGLAIGFVTSLSTEDWKYIQTNRECLFGALILITWSGFVYRQYKQIYV